MQIDDDTIETSFVADGEIIAFAVRSILPFFGRPLKMTLFDPSNLRYSFSCFLA